MARKGLKYAAFAPGTYVDGAAPVYSNGSIFAALVRADVSFTRSNAKLYADNGLHLTDNGITGGSVTIEVADLPDDAQVTVLGVTKAEDGIVYETDADAPLGGFGYVTTEEGDDGTDRFIGWLIYKTQFGMTSDNANTRGESTDFQTPSLEGTFMAVALPDVEGNSYRAHKTFSKESDARDWVKTQLSIT